MVISTTVYVEHPDLALVPTIRRLPDLDIEVVSHAGTAPKRDAYYFVVRADDFDSFERSLDADHTVDSYTAVDETGNTRTYRVVYSGEAMLVTPSVTDVGGLVVRSRNQDTGWALKLQLRDHESLHAIDSFAAENDIDFDVLELRHNDSEAFEVDSTTDFSLTDPQIEALVAAYVNGYYDADQDVTLNELSNLLGVSQSAVSGRLRRGAARLIEETLVGNDDH